MGRAPLGIDKARQRSVKFHGTWNLFSALLDVAEKCSREMAAEQIARRHSEPVTQPSSSPPVLPRNFGNAIDEMGGTNVMLVVEKSLYKTDVEPNNGRLAILFSKIRENFLTETERRSMENGENKEVMIIEPSLNVRTVLMTQWDMKKKKKKKKNKSGETTSSSMYVLKKHWNGVVRDNGLKEKDKLQVWSFRVGEDLRLALVLA